MTFLLDNFTGSGLLSAHTSDSGHTASDAYWPNGSNFSSLTLGSGVVTASGSGSKYGGGVYDAVPPSADYSVTGRLQFTHAGYYGEAHIGLRWVAGALGSDTDGYYIDIDCAGPTSISAVIWRKGSTNVNLNAGAKVYAVTDTTDFLATMKAIGSTISFEVDGVEVWSGTDAAITAAGGAYFKLIPYGPLPLTTALTSFYATDETVPDPAFWTNFVASTEI